MEARCGTVDADMMASDDGHNAWAPNFRSPSNSALEGLLPWGRLWQYPRIEMVDLFVARIAMSAKGAWFGCHLLLAPLIPRKPRMPKLGRFERVLVWGAFTLFFAESSSGRRQWVPMVEDAQRAVFRLTNDAQGGIFPPRRSGTSS